MLHADSDLLISVDSPYFVDVVLQSEKLPRDGPHLHPSLPYMDAHYLSLEQHKKHVMLTEAEMRKKK